MNNPFTVQKSGGFHHQETHQDSHRPQSSQLEPAGVEVYGREWGYRFTEEECSGVVECYLESYNSSWSHFHVSPYRQQVKGVTVFFLG